MGVPPVGEATHDRCTVVAIAASTRSSLTAAGVPVVTRIGTASPESPAPLAATENVYAVRSDNPVMEAAVPVTVAMPPPVTVYPAGVPPWAGALHARLAVSVPTAVTRTPPTAPGTAASVVTVTSRPALEPELLIAFTVQVYSVSGLRPVIAAAVPVTPTVPGPVTSYSPAVPPEAGASQLSKAPVDPAGAPVRFVTSPGAASVVTFTSAPGPAPPALFAVTVKVYSVSALSPVTVAAVPEILAVPPPATVYSVGVPPVSGACQVSVTSDPMAEPLRLRTGPGTGMTNVALALLSASIVSAQLLVVSAAHAPPQPENAYPLAGAATSVTAVPSISVAAQSVPQAMTSTPPASVPVTVPLLGAVTVSVRARPNAAVTPASPFTVTEHVLSRPVHAPLQPPNTYPASGVAVSISTLPLSTAAVQSVRAPEPHSIAVAPDPSVPVTWPPIVGAVTDSVACRDAATVCAASSFPAASRGRCDTAAFGVYCTETFAPSSAAAIVSAIVALAASALVATVTALTDAAEPSSVTAKSPAAGAAGDHTGSLSVSVAVAPSNTRRSIVGAVASTASGNWPLTVVACPARSAALTAYGT